MKKIFSLLAVTIAFSCTTTKVSVADSVLDVSDPTKYMNTITAAELKTHLYIVASDEMEGRETGSPGQKKAGLYLISQYVKNDISFPKGATSFYQRIPAAFLNAMRN